MRRSHVGLYSTLILLLLTSFVNIFRNGWSLLCREILRSLDDCFGIKVEAEKFHVQSRFDTNISVSSFCEKVKVHYNIKIFVL